MNMKMPNFNVKDLMREAGSTISTQVSRVVQVIVVFRDKFSFFIIDRWFCSSLKRNCISLLTEPSWTVISRPWLRGAKRQRISLRKWWKIVKHCWSRTQVCLYIELSLSFFNNFLTNFKATVWKTLFSRRLKRRSHRGCQTLSTLAKISSKLGELLAPMDHMDQRLSERV